MSSLDTQDPHPSPLREFRLDAGLTLHHLAKDLDTHIDSVWHWDVGSQRRPNAGHLRALVQRFKNRIDLPEAVRRFWKENIGDPCPCGCGGKKIFPDNDRAKHLYIELPCQICGTRSTKEVAAIHNVNESTVREWIRRGYLRPKRIYSDKTQHRPRCGGCRGYRASRAAKLETVKCFGYHLFDETIQSFVPSCLKRGREITRLRSKLLSQFKFRSDNPLQRPFVDIKSKRCRCAACAAMPRVTRALEKYTRNFFDKVGEAICQLQGNELREARDDFHKITSGGSLEPFYPDENMPRIRKRSELNERRRQGWKLSYKYKDRSRKTLIFMKAAFVKTERSKGPKDRVPGRKLITFIKKTLRGLCLLCPKAIFSYHEVKTGCHKKCLNDLRRERCDPHPPLPAARSGGQAERDNLERILIWLVRYKRRESLSDIEGHEFKEFKKSTVQSEIERARGYLPEDDKLDKRLRTSVSQLRSPARDL